MRKLLLMITLVLVGGLCPLVAQAQYFPEKSPWLSSVSFEEGKSLVTLTIWIDEGGTDGKGRNVRQYDWYSTQHYCRMECFNCDMGSWPDNDRQAAIMAHNLHDAQFTPLSHLTFLPLAISVNTSLGGAVHYTWRMSDADSVILTLKDGRRLVSLPPKSLDDPHANIFGRGSEEEQTCWSYKLALQGRTLYTETELTLMAKQNKEQYSDQPWANNFLIPFETGERSFTPKDITSVALMFQGRRLDLHPRVLLTTRAQ